MLNTLHSPTHQEAMLSSLMMIVRAEDGDFSAIDPLVVASGDPDSLNLIIQHLARHPQCKIALTNRQSLGAIDLTALQQLPIDTLGYRYAHHLSSNRLKQLVAAPATSAAEFIDIHLRETHDLWHVVTDSPVGILGEIKLQGFCVAQLQLSRFWLALLTKNLAKAAVYDIEVADAYMNAVTTGWMMGKAAQPLFGVDWHALWELPLDRVRASLNINLVEI